MQVKTIEEIKALYVPYETDVSGVVERVPFRGAAQMSPIAPARCIEFEKLMKMYPPDIIYGGAGKTTWYKWTRKVPCVIVTYNLKRHPDEQYEEVFFVAK